LRFDGTQIGTPESYGKRRGRRVSATVSRGERIKLAAMVVAVALVMGAVGALLVVLGGWPRPVGFVLLAFAVAGVGQGVAIAAGHLTPRGSEDAKDRDAHGE
jgi:uncharacterized membrane protein YphA (DoxX/SURF4 family)